MAMLPISTLSPTYPSTILHGIVFRDSIWKPYGVACTQQVVGVAYFLTTVVAGHIAAEKPTA